jgi:hypothetical protein
MSRHTCLLCDRHRLRDLILSTIALITATDDGLAFDALDLRPFRHSTSKSIILGWAF